jgi:hypothetical protein
MKTLSQLLDFQLLLGLDILSETSQGLLEFIMSVLCLLTVLLFTLSHLFRDWHFERSDALVEFVPIIFRQIAHEVRVSYNFGCIVIAYGEILSLWFPVIVCVLFSNKSGLGEVMLIADFVCGVLFRYVLGMMLFHLVVKLFCFLPGLLHVVSSLALKGAQLLPDIFLVVFAFLNYFVEMFFFVLR